MKAHKTTKQINQSNRNQEVGLPLRSATSNGHRSQKSPSNPEWDITTPRPSRNRNVYTSELNAKKYGNSGLGLNPTICM